MHQDSPLLDLLSEGICLNINTTIANRRIPSHKGDVRDNIHELLKLDPLELLGENDYGKPIALSEEFTGSPIQEFFRGANVFITGATGFVGKALTEKLIRSVPHIGHIYLLIRAKRTKTPQERFHQILENKVFSRMKTEVPDYLDKITVISGDITMPGLGLCPAYKDLLVDNVNVVFHSAADVRFLEPLRACLESNVLGSRHVMDLSKEMTNLKCYVHVSTAYSHCVLRVIEEKVPQLSINYKEILEYIATKTEEELEKETPRLLQGWPNTYTFSKAVCENMIQSEAGELPLCIVRPSVVISTFREPIRGWIDNLYGPIGLIVGTGHGILHCYRQYGGLPLQHIPVDCLVNLMIAAAWKTGCRRAYVDMQVFNLSASTLWKDVNKSGLLISDIYPFDRAIWYTSYFSTESHLVYTIGSYVLHKLPGYCFDQLAKMAGTQPMLMKLYQRIDKLEDTMMYINSRLFEFKTDNVFDLWQILDEKDKAIFNFDTSDFNFYEYVIYGKLGVKRYYLNEKLEDLPVAGRRNTRLKCAHICLKIVCSLAVLKVMVLLARALPF